MQIIFKSQLMKWQSVALLVFLVASLGCGEDPEVTMLRAIYENDTEAAKEAIENGVHQYSRVEKGTKIVKAWQTGNKAHSEEKITLNASLPLIKNASMSPGVLDLFLQMNLNRSQLDMIIQTCYERQDYASVEAIYERFRHARSANASKKALSKMKKYNDEVHQHVKKLMDYGMSISSLNLAALAVKSRSAKLLAFFEEEKIHVNDISTGKSSLFELAHNKINSRESEDFFLTIIRMGANYQEMTEGKKSKRYGILARAIQTRAPKSPEFIDKLLDLNLDLNFMTVTQHNTDPIPMAFHLAANIKPKAFEKAIAKGLDPTVSHQGETITHFLKIPPDILVKHGVNINYGNPFEKAITKGKMDYALALVNAGYEFWRHPATLVHISKPSNNKLKLKVFEALANPPQGITKDRFLNEMSRWLNIAIKRRDIDTARVILRTGLDLNQPWDGEWPLLAAARLNNSDLLMLLVKSGADPEIFVDDQGTRLIENERFNAFSALKPRLIEAARQYKSNK